MSDYQQPQFYRFNEDSIHLVKRVLKEVLSAERVLDLGAGCGIMGIEVSRILKPRYLELVEVQEEFTSYLRLNSAFLTSSTEVMVRCDSFGKWRPEEKFDLILCNPPYYLPGHGERNQDPRKEIARSFVIDGWEVLLSRIAESLSPEGSAWLVIKDDDRLKEIIMRKRTPWSVCLETSGHLCFVKLTGLNVD